MSTVESTGATVSMSFRTRRRAALCPTISGQVVRRRPLSLSAVSPASFLICSIGLGWLSLMVASRTEPRLAVVGANVLHGRELGAGTRLEPKTYGAADCTEGRLCVGCHDRP